MYTQGWRVAVYPETKPHTKDISSTWVDKLPAWHQRFLSHWARSLGTVKEGSWS
jgi:hypothetical protein